MNLLYLMAWCLICVTPITTYKRKDRHIVKPKTENWVEPTVNSEVTSSEHKDKELKFRFWQQQRNSMEHVSKAERQPEQTQSKVRHKKKQNHKSNIPALLSFNGKIYRPKKNREIAEKYSLNPLMSENGLIIRPNDSAMKTIIARNGKSIEEYRELSEKKLSDLRHLIDEALGVRGKPDTDKLTEWLGEQKREVFAAKDSVRITKCAPGEIKLTKTYVCVPCTVFFDLEDKANLCDLEDFKRVCVQSWTEFCNLKLPNPTTRVLTLKDYD